jgi:hypothetical protein
MLKALLWKDFRVQRVALLAALCVIAAPYGYVVYNHLGNGAVASSAAGLLADLDYAGQLTLMASLLIVAMLAGAAFASERSDRSHEFLAALPPTRLMILGSKAVVVLAATGALWLLNPYVFVRIARVFTVEWRPSGVSEDAVLGTVSAMALSVLGAGWFGSILVSNPASSLLIGLLSPFFSLLFAYGICDPTRNEDGFHFTFVCACLVLGVSSLVGGTICYLRREEA